VYTKAGDNLMGEVIDLDERRKIWTYEHMHCQECDCVWTAVFAVTCKSVECPGCGSDVPTNM
jgi:uncharacterized paraquat-inducible protein A